MSGRGKTSILWLTVIALTAGGLYLGQYFLGYNPAGLWLNKLFAGPAAYVFQKANLFRVAADSIANFRNTSAENERLKKEITSLQARLAGFEITGEENEDLRKAVKLAARLPLRFIEAEIFGLSESAGYTGTLNGGSDSGIQNEQAVITREGALIGVVAAVNSGTSAVKLLIDPSFSVTAAVSGISTKGIVKGNGTDGLLFDLITQTDEIKTGDVIVTTGSDKMPAGLVVGTVREVSDNKDNVFKKVLIEPAYNISGFGRIFVVSEK